MLNKCCHKIAWDVSQVGYLKDKSGCLDIFKIPYMMVLSFFPNCTAIDSPLITFSPATEKDLI